MHGIYLARMRKEPYGCCCPSNLDIYNIIRCVKTCQWILNNMVNFFLFPGLHVIIGIAAIAGAMVLLIIIGLVVYKYITIRRQKTYRSSTAQILPETLPLTEFESDPNSSTHDQS